MLPHTKTGNAAGRQLPTARVLAFSLSNRWYDIVPLEVMHAWLETPTRSRVRLRAVPSVRDTRLRPRSADGRPGSSRSEGTLTSPGAEDSPRSCSENQLFQGLLPWRQEGPLYGVGGGDGPAPLQWGEGTPRDRASPAPPSGPGRWAAAEHKPRASEALVTGHTKLSPPGDSLIGEDQK